MRWVGVVGQASCRAPRERSCRVRRVPLLEASSLVPVPESEAHVSRTPFVLTQCVQLSGEILELLLQTLPCACLLPGLLCFSRFGKGDLALALRCSHCFPSRITQLLLFLTFPPGVVGFVLRGLHHAPADVAERVLYMHITPHAVGFLPRLRIGFSRQVSPQLLIAFRPRHTLCHLPS